MEKNIYIIGAGAIGKTLAVALKRNNKNVVLLRGSVDDGTRTREKIEVLIDGRDPLEAEIEVRTLSDYPTLDGIVVLTTKSYGNEQLAKTLRNKTGNSPIVIFQNGLGVEQPFIDNHFPEVYRCVIFVASQTISPHLFQYKPVTVSPIGVIQGNHDTLRMLVNELHTDIVPFTAEDDIQPIIWKKAIFNSVFNSIGALLETDNGILHRNETALNMARMAIEEGCAIAAAKGIFLDPIEMTETVKRLSKGSDGHVASTRQDIEARRLTEIDTLNIEITRIAKTLGKEDAVNTIRLLGELTKLKSELAIQA